MAIEIPNQEHTVGIPSQWKDTIAAPLGALFLSTHPPALTFDYVIAANQDMKANTVVGFNGDNEIVPAVKGTVEAIGVLPIDVKTGAAPLVGTGVYRAGHFNHKRLVWDASYATDADKVMAFEGAPTPTNIRIGTPRSYTP
ncbi:head decoration protein [Ochrobactrum sp. WV_118_8]